MISIKEKYTKEDKLIADALREELGGIEPTAGQILKRKQELINLIPVEYAKVKSEKRFLFLQFALIFIISIFVNFVFASCLCGE